MTYAPARPPRKTRSESPLGLAVAALVIVVVLAVLFLFGMNAHNLGGKEMAAAAPTAPKLPGVGKAVRDGKFEFVVRGVDCSKSSVGVEHLKRTAKGRYCVVGLSVENVAGKSQYFVGRAQKAY